GRQVENPAIDRLGFGRPSGLVMADPDLENIAESDGAGRRGSVGHGKASGTKVVQPPARSNPAAIDRSLTCQSLNSKIARLDPPPGKNCRVAFRRWAKCLLPEES